MAMSISNWSLAHISKVCNNVQYGAPYSHAIMNACADHRSSSPRMKMKTAEEFKIYRGFGVGEVRSPNHLLAVNRLGSCLHAAF